MTELYDQETAHSHFLLAEDEVCEKCAKTPLQIAAERELERHSLFVSSLRELADWWEQHPDVETPWNQALLVHVDTKEELAQVARALGKCEKYGDDDWFGVKRRFGSIEVDAYGQRQKICTRVVVGTREVVREVTDPDAPKLQVTETEEIVDWVCEPLLAVPPGGAS